MGRAQDLLDTNSFVRWLLFFVTTSMLHVYAVFQPPLWDSAMCIVPAALTLSSLNFDLLTLLQMPQYAQGGPNCHSLSLVTWMLTVVIKVTNSMAYIPILHVVIFAWMALGFSAIYEFGRTALSPHLTWLFCAAVMLYPPIFVQTGEIYLDGPVLASVALALTASAKGQLWRAAIWATVAVLTKESGAIAAAAIALSILLTSTDGWTRRLRHAVKATFLPIGAAIGIFVIAHSGSIAAPSSPGVFSLDLVITLYQGLYFDGFYRYLLNAPDLLVVMVIGTLLSLWMLIRTTQSYSFARPSTPLVLASGAILSFVALMYIAMPLVFRLTQTLIRYHLVIFPTCLFMICYVLSKKYRGKLTLAFLIAANIFFLANLDGRFYPSFIERFGNDFSIAER